METPPGRLSTGPQELGSSASAKRVARIAVLVLNRWSHGGGHAIHIPLRIVTAHYAARSNASHSARASFSAFVSRPALTPSRAASSSRVAPVLA